MLNPAPNKFLNPQQAKLSQTTNPSSQHRVPSDSSLFSNQNKRASVLKRDDSADSCEVKDDHPEEARHRPNDEALLNQSIS